MLIKGSQLMELQLLSKHTVDRNLMVPKCTSQNKSVFKIYLTSYIRERERKRGSEGRKWIKGVSTVFSIVFLKKLTSLFHETEVDSENWGKVNTDNIYQHTKKRSLHCIFYQTCILISQWSRVLSSLRTPKMEYWLLILWRLCESTLCIKARKLFRFKEQRKKSL